jgi:hypothetical protein
MVNKLLLVLLFFLVIPIYCQDVLVKDNLVWITDLNINYRINPLPQRVEFYIYQDEVQKEVGERGRIYLTSDIGALIKINNNVGFGISHFIGVDSGDDGLRNGIKFKYRQWFNNGSYFDISPGFTIFDSAFKTPGFISSIDWWKNEFFALTVLFEYLPKKPDSIEKWVNDGGYIETLTNDYEKDFGIYCGVKTGSKWGLLGSGSILIIAIAGALMMGG